METRLILERLKNLKNAIANKSDADNSECLHFLQKRILAIKSDIIISTKNLTEILGSFPAKDIIKGLEVIKSEDVSFIDDDGILIIKSDSSKIKISCNDEEFEKFSNYEDLVSIRKNSWIDLPDGYMDGLLMCAETASRDIKDGEVSCVAIKNKIVEATDNVRASVFLNKLKIGEDTFLSASNVKKLPQNCSKISITESMVHFGWGTYTYSLPKIGVDFPDINGAVQSWVPDERENIPFPRELISLAKDLEYFCGGNDYEKNVRVTFTPKEIKCSARSDTASITKRIENTTGRKNGSFKINPTLLSSMLSDNDEVFIHEDKIFFMRKNFIHVIGM